MKTAFEAALERCLIHQRDGCPVPSMTHPLAQHWKQPDPCNWCFSATEVLMPQSDFEQLLDYSHSAPTGVYEGKMWRSSDDGKEWHLHWWSPASRPGYCKDNVRTIITV